MIPIAALGAVLLALLDHEDEPEDESDRYQSWSASDDGQDASEIGFVL